MYAINLGLHSLSIIKMFKTISLEFKMPVDILLASCHGGLSHEYVDLLPKGSKLITFRSDDQEIDG